jgi:hypothetical protein
MLPTDSDTSRDNSGIHVIATDNLQLVIAPVEGGCHIREIALRTTNGCWQSFLSGMHNAEFATTLGCINAADCKVEKTDEGGWEVRLSGKADGWEASGIITMIPGKNYLRRRQTYRFTRDCEAAICPGFMLKSDAQIRYTFPLRSWEEPLDGLSPLRSAVDWALPLPFHIWHDSSIVAIYGVDKSVSPGTIDFIPPDANGNAVLRVYYPDTARQTEIMGGPGWACPAIPGLKKFAAGEEITVEEILGARLLAVGEEPLLEAERMAADILLRTPEHAADLPAVARGIAEFYRHCELWEPDAFGPGRGWFTNMWVRTQIGPAKKRGEMSGYFDFGWGEGIAVEMMQGAVRYWKRTGDASLLPYVDEMTRNIELFKRAPGDDQPYYDRSDGRRFGDFLMDLDPGNRIWTHSLAHSGSQLLQLYQIAPDYPNVETRREWLAAAKSMASFLAKHQKPDGDLQDIYDDDDREVNIKPHRITARAAVCGLWVRLAQISGDDEWTVRAQRLAAVLVPEINRYEYYGQMLDGIHAPTTEYIDGEAAYYVLEGLVPLYDATRDPAILALCRKTAAFGIAWTYFYDVPKAHNGIARGGQCCRMNDFPLLYPIGSAKSMGPLLELYVLTGDQLFKTVASEAAAFIGNWQMNDPGKPWDGGMIHAIGQYCGKHWGPDLAGQVDSGMTTGNSLAAIERWLAHIASQCTDKETSK